MFWFPNDNLIKTIQRVKIYAAVRLNNYVLNKVNIKGLFKNETKLRFCIHLFPFYSNCVNAEVFVVNIFKEVKVVFLYV